VLFWLNKFEALFTFVGIEKVNTKKRREKTKKEQWQRK